MGNENSNYNSIKEEFLKKYNFLYDLKLKNMIQCKIYFKKEEKNNKILLIEKTFFIKNEIENYILNLNNLVNLNKDYILKIKILSKKLETNICQDVYYILVSSEYYSNNLEKEIRNKKSSFSEKKNYFKEEEIWYLINILSVSSYEFLNFSIYHKDIQPKNILITDDGEFKINFSCYLHGYESNYNLILENKSNISALSPNQMEGLKRYKLKIDENLEKSETFSIGITLLSMITLTDMKKFYDMINNDINFYKIKKKLNLWPSLGYSIELLNWVEKLLKIRENERIGIKELYNETKSKKFIKSLNSCSWMTN